MKDKIPISTCEQQIQTYHSNLVEIEKNIEIGPLFISYFKRIVYWNDTPIDLTKQEFNFLYLLASAPERVYTYEQIYQNIWKEYPLENITNIIWCLVYRIKKKLRKIDIEAYKMICNIKKTGYCLKLNKEQYR